MSDFATTLAKGTAHQVELVKFLDLHGIPYLETGQEYRPGSSLARNRMRESFDRISNRVRFFPDLIVYLASGPIFVESKCSSGIERRAYNAYCEIEREYGEHVWIYRRDHRLTPLRGLRFRVPKSPDPISRIAVPIEAGVWIMPESLPGWIRQKHIYAYRKAGRTSSGMNYALIDFVSSESYGREILSTGRMPTPNPIQSGLFE